MAEGEDRSQKTEEPTQKRLEDARKKGEVASSREVNHWFMILAGTVVVLTVVPRLMSDVSRVLSGVLENAHAVHIDPAALRDLAADLAASIFPALLPTILLLVGAALAAGLVQHGPVLSAEKIKPKLDKISLGKGFKRMFSGRSVMELVKGMLKLAVVGSIAVLLVLPEFGRITSASALEPQQFLNLLWLLTLRMLGGICAVVTVIAALDFFYQKFEHHKQMRMSKQEIKDELKQSEGDPMIKARLRQLRLERARKRMMAAVPEADVVITNPTHFAVALKYDPDTMAAPKLLAKGVDAVALRIRDVADEHDIAVVENPPLARALYGAVELDEEIPETHYKAVAEVIGYVWRLKRKVPPRPH